MNLMPQDIKLEDLQLPEEEYIRVKKLAYNSYSEYSALSEKEQAAFLNWISTLTLDSPTKTVILQNSLLLPDTKELLDCVSENINKDINKIYSKFKDVPQELVSFKILEYQENHTYSLIEQGKLVPVETEILECISEAEYLKIKQEEIENHKVLKRQEIKQQKKIIEQYVLDTSYEGKVRLSTLLVPNDKALLEQLPNASVEDLANKYKVPSGVIEFKKNEYKNQKTAQLVSSGKLPEPSIEGLWYSLWANDTELVNKYPNVNYYTKRLEEEHAVEVCARLSTIFTEEKTTKKR